jgi:hypothetical protein
MAAPPPVGQLGLKTPFFLRKLPRKNSWGDPSTPLERRVEEVVRTVFLRDPKPYSLFQVATDEELRRVTMGVNSGRDSLKEDVAYIPILAEELETAGIRVDQTAGDTRCVLANRLHRDIPAEDASLRNLCRMILQANRSVLSLSSSPGRRRPRRKAALPTRIRPSVPSPTVPSLPRRKCAAIRPTA